MQKRHPNGRSRGVMASRVTCARFQTQGPTAAQAAGRRPGRSTARAGGPTDGWCPARPTAGGPGARGGGRHPGGVGGGQLGVPGAPQADRAVLSGERRARQAPARDVADVRVAVHASMRPPSSPPELLAALAQVESGGNPVARTYWRWRADVRIPWTCTGRRRARSACTRSPTGRSRRPSGTASTTTWWSRTAPGTTCARAGSTASTRGSCRPTPSS